MSEQREFPVAGIVGVINLMNEKPDVLRYAATVDDALRMGQEYREAGFAGLDIGAQSSHYAVRRMSAQEQIDRLVPVVEALTADGHPVAVETEIGEVIRACAEAGAVAANLSGSVRDDAVLREIGELDLMCITSFTPRDTPFDVDGVDIERDLRGQYAVGLRANVERLRAAGVRKLIVDAGIGYSYPMPYSEFSKYQVETIRQTRALGETFGLPTLVAVPRVPNEWLIAAFTTLAVEYGASLLRCHDPAVGEVARLLGFIPGDITSA